MNRRSLFVLTARQCRLGATNNICTQIASRHVLFKSISDQARSLFTSSFKSSTSLYTRHQIRYLQSFPSHTVVPMPGKVCKHFTAHILSEQILYNETLSQINAYILFDMIIFSFSLLYLLFLFYFILHFFNLPT